LLVVAYVLSQSFIGQEYIRESTKKDQHKQITRMFKRPNDGFTIAPGWNHASQLRQDSGDVKGRHFNRLLAQEASLLEVQRKKGRYGWPGSFARRSTVAVEVGISDLQQRFRVVVALRPWPDRFGA
jgi:hypothetical protein